RSFWSARHAMCPSISDRFDSLLPMQFKKLGYSTALVTDEYELTQFSVSSAFEEIVFIRDKQSEANSSRASDRNQTSIAETENETAVADFVIAVNQWIKEAKQPFYLWLHTGTLGQVWDAPLELREQYAAEDDPTPGDNADVPNLILPQNFDPD